MTRVLYIAGTSYCGSTLLSFLLNAHRRMASIGEATGPTSRYNTPDFPCSCGELLEACPFWRQVAARMAEAGFDFARDRWGTAFELGGRFARRLLVRSLWNNRIDAVRDALLRATPAGRKLALIAQRNVALFDAVLAVTGKDVFVDASKDPIRLRYLRRIDGLDLKVVHLVRDPRGLVSSMVKNEDRAIGSSVRIYNRSAAHMRRVKRLLGAERVLRVRYEDLCGDVGGQLARIWRFAGVEPMEVPVRFRAAEHHIIGNHMRMADSEAIRLDESWRDRLTEAQASAVLRVTRFVRKRFGYE